jgi:hypothetical protein
MNKQKRPFSRDTIYNREYRECVGSHSFGPLHWLDDKTYKAECRNCPFIYKLKVAGHFNHSSGCGACGETDDYPMMKNGECTCTCHECY